MIRLSSKSVLVYRGRASYAYDRELLIKLGFTFKKTKTGQIQVWSYGGFECTKEFNQMLLLMKGTEK